MDHENWIEQHNKHDSCSCKVETFLNDTIIITKYYSVDTWACPFMVHIKEGVNFTIRNSDLFKIKVLGKKRIINK